jgi:hypothetical protein
MARPKKEEVNKEVAQEVGELAPNAVPSIHDIEWTDYVLSMLSDDEKIKGNPTTDGLRRVLEKALNCRIIESSSRVVQSPSPENEKRATVTHTLRLYLNNADKDAADLNMISVDGSADVYWGNCDKVYRNHPVAVAETRAEGRALKRALRLRKVVAAEELASDVEDHPDGNSVDKITNNQINFIDVMAQRMNINVSKLLEINSLDSKDIYSLHHTKAVDIIRLLSKYQTNMSEIPDTILGYSNEWK